MLPKKFKTITHLPQKNKNIPRIYNRRESLPKEEEYLPQLDIKRKHKNSILSTGSTKNKSSISPTKIKISDWN